MIIRIFLSLFFAALVFLIIADVFYELHLGTMADLILQLGDDVLLVSFALLLMSGGAFFGKQILRATTEFFSAKQRAQRQLYFSIARNNDLQRLFASKKKQLLYFANLKKTTLLAKNNQKHCQLLAKAMLKELTQIKHQLSETQFKTYQQAIKQAAVQQQIEQLLELQRKIFTPDF